MKINSFEDEDSDKKSDNSGSKNKASSIFTQVGPQAPQLSNRIKGSKSFSFNFMSTPEPT